MVYNLCLNYLHSEADAEEATQDVFLKVYQQQDRFRKQASPKTWIYRIAVNQCLDRIKAQKRKKRFAFLQSLTGRGPNEEDMEIPTLSHPGIELEDKEAVGRILRAMNELPEKQNAALHMKVMDQLSQKEISAILQLSEKAVESLLSRAKSNLKKKLSEGKG